MLHGASEAIAGDKKDKTLRDEPVIGGLVDRFVKGSIGQAAIEARETKLTGSGEKILKNAGITWRPAEASPEINNLPLTRSEYAAYQNAINKGVDTAIHKAAAHPDWNSWTTTQKEQYLNHQVDMYRIQARNEIYRSIPPDERERRIGKLREDGKIPAAATPNPFAPRKP
jgi:hypothetical protein